MGRAEQRIYQMPLLYEIAVCGGTVSSHRGDRQLARIRRKIGEYFDVDKQATEERYAKSGKKKFETEVNYAKKQLESEGFLEVRRNEEWVVKKEGLQRLRKFFTCQLRRMPAKGRAAYFRKKERGEKTELSMNMLRRVESTTLKELLQGASSIRELPLLALDGMPLEEFREFLVASYDFNADFFFRTPIPAEFLA